MSTSITVHMDCRNYAPLDVTKGVCHRTKQMVLADEPSCDSFNALPRCKLCRHYVPSEKPMVGICAAEPERPMTYPDLVAVTCEWFDIWEDSVALDG